MRAVRPSAASAASALLRPAHTICFGQARGLALVACDPRNVYLRQAENKFNRALRFVSARGCMLVRRSNGRLVSPAGPT